MTARPFAYIDANRARPAQNRAKQPPEEDAGRTHLVMAAAVELQKGPRDERFGEFARDFPTSAPRSLHESEGQRRSVYSV